MALSAWGVCAHWVDPTSTPSSPWVSGVSALASSVQCSEGSGFPETPGQSCADFPHWSLLDSGDQMLMREREGAVLSRRPMGEVGRGRTGRVSQTVLFSFIFLPSCNASYNFLSCICDGSPFPPIPPSSPHPISKPNPHTDSEGASGCPWSTARATAPSPGRPTPGVVKQDKSSGGSVDTTKTRSGPQRVRMSSGERPIGAAKGKQPNTKALCHPPPPPISPHFPHSPFPRMFPEELRSEKRPENTNAGNSGGLSRTAAAPRTPRARLHAPPHRHRPAAIAETKPGTMLPGGGGRGGPGLHRAEGLRCCRLPHGRGQSPPPPGPCRCNEDSGARQPIRRLRTAMWAPADERLP